MSAEPDQESERFEDSALAAHLLDAVLVEQRRAWLGGLRIPAEEWLSRHPALNELACAVEVVYQEYLLRQELGEAPAWDDYPHRFPQYATALQELHEADQLVTEVLTPAEPARRFGHFELLAKIGEGGMGVVYKALQHGLGRIVALKMLRGGEYADEKERRRFLREAQAVANLQHAHIVSLYEVGEVDALPFLALEFVEGRSLAACLDGTPWEPRSAAALVETLARAVAYAHGRGIIHRDLKPSNVLLAGPVTGPPEQGAPKIADFGLAKRLDGTSQSRSGHLVGTPSYMAPEAADPRLGVIGPATDVYGLGAVLYELLTGRPPFRADSLLKTFRQVVEEEPAPPRILNPALPRDLETICLKCLHKEPAGRYHSAAAMADDLRRFLRGEPVSARPVGRVSRLWRWSRRNRALAGALAAVFLAVVAGLASVSYQWHRTNIEWRRAEAARRAAEASDAEAIQIFSELTQNSSSWALGGPAGNLGVNRLDDVGPYAATPHTQLELGEVKQILAPFEKADAHGTRLLQRDPHNLPLRRALTSLRISRGALYCQQGDMDKGAQCYSRACDLWTPLVRDDPANRDFHDWLANADIWRAQAWVGDFARRFEAIEEAQSLWQELTDDQPASPALMSRHVLCRELILQDIAGSTSAARQALNSLTAQCVRMETRLQTARTRVYLRRKLAFTYLVLATIHDQEPAPLEAMPLWKRARGHYRALAGRSHVDLMTKFNLACCDARLMRPTADDPDYAEAIHLFTEVHGWLVQTTPAVAQDGNLRHLRRQTLEALALCCWKAGNDLEAEKWVHELTRTTAKPGRAPSIPQRPSLGWIWQLASAAEAFRTTRPSAALAMTRQAASLLHQYDPDSILDRQVRHQLGADIVLVATLQCQLNLPAESLHSAQVARRVFEGLCRDIPGMPAYRSRLHGAWVRIAKAHWALRQFDEAIADFRQGVTSQRQALEQVPHSLPCRLILSRAYEQLGFYCREDRQWAAAVDAQLQRDKLWPTDPQRRLLVAKDLAELAEIMGKQPNLTPVVKTQRQRCLTESRRIRQAVEALHPPQTAAAGVDLSQ